MAKILYLFVATVLMAACSTNPTIVQSSGGAGLYLDVQPNANSYKLGAGTVKSDFLMAPNETKNGQVLTATNRTYGADGAVTAESLDTRSAVAFFEGNSTALIDFGIGDADTGTGIESAAAVGAAADRLVLMASCIEAAGTGGSAEFCR
jgi:hypothetical protein